jgi:MoxR-like ATPase/Mg-chelatase subunit ChlD
LNKHDLAGQIAEQLVGRKREIRLILAAVRSGTPVLIEGGVGRGKTKISLEVAKALQRPFFRVDGAPDMSVQKIVGWFDPSLVLLESEEAEKRDIKPGFSWDTFIDGPLTRAMKEGGILFVNEGTRLPSDTWNALLTAMDERIVVIPKLGTVKAEPGFSVIVTANPMEHAGAYPLPEAAADRFVWVPMERQDSSEEREIIRRELLLRGYQEISKSEQALDVIEACVNQTYHHPDLAAGVSVRAGIQMGCIIAELDGDPRDQDVVLQAALMAFQKKLKLKDNVTKTREQIIAEIVNAAFHGSFGGRTSGTRDRPNQASKSGEEPPSEDDSDEFEDWTDKDRKKKATAIRSEKAVSQREVYSLRSYCKDKPERVAEQLNSDPEYVKEVQGANPEVFLQVFHKIRPWLNEKVYDLILHTYTDSVLRKAEEIYLTGAKSPAMRRVDYEAGREVDWDETIDNYTETIGVNRDTIVSKEPLRVKRSLVLMMDQSGSMAGRKILTAALCTGVLSHALKDEEFAVLLFSGKTCVLKKMTGQKDLHKLIREILEQQPEGYTDIKGALDSGLKQMANASFKTKIGVLITDGIHTTGDPVPTAEEYPALHVMATPSPRGKVVNFENCRRLAKAGKGKFLVLRNYEDVPSTVLRLLRYD